jgi:hypothetical protein
LQVLPTKETFEVKNNSGAGFTDICWRNAECSAYVSFVQVSYSTAAWPIYLNVGGAAEDSSGRLDTALALEPDSPLANLAFAGGLEDLGRRVEAAAELFEKASKLYSGNEKAAADSELNDGHLIMYLPEGEGTTKLNDDGVPNERSY